MDARLDGAPDVRLAIFGREDQEPGCGRRVVGSSNRTGEAHGLVVVSDDDVAPGRRRARVVETVDEGLEVRMPTQRGHRVPRGGGGQRE